MKEEVYQSKYIADNSFTYTLNKGGLYSVKVEAMRESPWSSTVGHSLSSVEAKLKKADLSQVKWDYDPAKPFCFNHQPHKVQVIQAPEGLSVKDYSYQEATMPGTHRTLAYFNYDPDVYEDPRTAALYWEITGPRGPELAIDRTVNGLMIKMLDEGFATSYALYRKRHDGEFFLSVYEGEDSFFEDTDAEYGESYDYMGVSIVKYENEDYPGPYGPRATITVLDKSKILTSELSDDGSLLTLTWTPVKAAMKYRVRARIAVGNGKFEVYHYGCDEPVGLFGVEPGKAHYFSVAPCLDEFYAQTGVPSDEIKVVPMPVPPRPEVKTLSADSLQITMPEIPGADRYDLWRSEAANGTYQVAFTGDGRVFVDQGLKKDTSYFYQYRYYKQVPEEGLLMSQFGPAASGKTKAVLRGDANNDDTVNTLDLISLVDYIISKKPCPSMINADADGSGGKPDENDFVWIVNQIVK